jgi:hypothetical protein
MALKRIFSISLMVVGIFLIVSSLTIFQTITGNIIGVNSTSRIIGGLGILFMILAVIIENYKFKKKK